MNGFDLDQLGNTMEQVALFLSSQEVRGQDAKYVTDFWQAAQKLSNINLESPNADYGTFFKAMSRIFVDIAYLTFGNPQFRKLVFDNDKVKGLDYQDFYNFGYCFAYKVASTQKSQTFLSFVLKEISQLTLKSLLSIKELQEEEIPMSEFELFDAVSELSERDAFLVLEYLPTSRENISILKKCVLTNDDSEFSKVIVSENINYNRVVTPILMYKKMSLFRRMHELMSLDENLKEELKKAFIQNLKEELKKAFKQMSEFPLEEEQSRILKEDLMAFDVAERGEIPKINWARLYSLHNSCLPLLICIHHWVLPYVEDVDQYSKTDNFIHSWNYGSEILRKIENGTYTFQNFIDEDVKLLPETIKPLELFKKKFISKLMLPSNDNGKPNLKQHAGINDEYFFETRFDRFEAMDIYNKLAENNFIAWDSETCYSFLYRASSDYFNVETKPSIITWYGTRSELYTMIEICFGDTPKRWHKNKKFFEMFDKSEIKSLGVVKQATSETIKKLLSEFEVKKM